MFAIRNLLLVLLVLVSSRLFATSDTCTPQFPYHQSWWGGDSAYSIPIPMGKTLWLFGDSFINANHNEKRKNATIMSNTIGISECNNHHFTIKYYWHKSNKPSAFFQTKQNKVLWPQGGFFLWGNVYIVLNKINREKNSIVFGFKYQGALLATIKNPQDKPESWHIDYQNLSDNSAYTIGYPYLSHGFITFFTIENNQNHSIIFTRFHIQDLGQQQLHWQFLNKQNQWQNGLDWTKAKIIMKNAATEMSVLYDQHHKKWYTIYSQFPNNILFRKADALTGPWTKAKIIYQVPHINKTSTTEFCYAAKFHPRFEVNFSHALITYVCNSTKFQHLISDLSLYQPKILYFNILKEKIHA